MLLLAKFNDENDNGRTSICVYKNNFVEHSNCKPISN